MGLLHYTKKVTAYWLVVASMLLALYLAGLAHTGSTVTRVGNAELPRMHFAIADLDGDKKPDIAFVEVERQQAASTDYAVRLRFGGGIDSHIGVHGPGGGLELAVRDVNGDESPDLILTSVVNPRVVQVLLNDGHGNFSAADTGSFVSVENGPQFGPPERAGIAPEEFCLGTARSSGSELQILQERQSSAARDRGVPFGVGDRLTPTSHGIESTSGRSPPAILTLS